jgi:hypothetical protein
VPKFVKETSPCEEAGCKAALRTLVAGLLEDHQHRAIGRAIVGVHGGVPHQDLGLQPLAAVAADHLEGGVAHQLHLGVLGVGTNISEGGQVGILGLDGGNVDKPGRVGVHPGVGVGRNLRGAKLGCARGQEGVGLDVVR